MKTIEVAAAVIVDSFENTTAVFATERGYGEFKGQWEFPGGKIEVGETPQQALIRENCTYRSYSRNDENA